MWYSILRFPCSVPVSDRKQVRWVGRSVGGVGDVGKVRERESMSYGGRERASTLGEGECEDEDEVR